MTEEELTTMVQAEEKRLGVGSKEFLKVHNEIMRKVELLKTVQLKESCGLHNSGKMPL